MTDLTIRLHPQAVAEARAAFAWYRQRSEAAADAFIDQLDHAISQIGAAPARWPTYRHGTRRYLLRRFPFFVVYRKLDDEIQIIAVPHARRRPGYWSDRTS